MDENQISQVIVESTIEVHRTLGRPGLLESVYREALIFELRARGRFVEYEKLVPIRCKGQTLKSPLRLDVLIDDLVIIECKAVSEYHPIFESQTLTYLRLTGLKLGLVVNFGQKLVKHGIHRVVNGL